MNSSTFARVTAAPRNALMSFVEWLATPRWLIGAGILRACFGFIVFSLMAIHLRQRHLLWGDDGLLSHAQYWHWFGHRSGFDIFALSANKTVFEILFFAGLLVAALFTVGLYSRFVTPLFAVLAWSLYHRDPWITNGGTRLLCIISLYLIVADLGQYFSLDALFRKSAAQGASWLRTMLHNAAILLIIAQVALVYIFSTFYKIEGLSWQQGTAIYYALMEPQFHVSPLIGPVLSSAVIVTLLTYGTLLYQSAFPWLILHPRLKWLAIAAGFSFHLGIAALMGLWWFSAVLISCEAVLITDTQYRELFRVFASMFATSPAIVQKFASQE